MPLKHKLIVAALVANTVLLVVILVIKFTH